jgi:SRSO17 transposase
VFKPKQRLKVDDVYQTKLQLAQTIIEELVEFGFKIELVLADSLYGESHPFVGLLDRLNYRGLWQFARITESGCLRMQNPNTATGIALDVSSQMENRRTLHPRNNIWSALAVALLDVNQ